MNEEQFIWLASNWKQLTFQSLIFHENGELEAEFFDAGGNFHHLTLNPDHTITTHQI